MKDKKSASLFQKEQVMESNKFLQENISAQIQYVA